MERTFLILGAVFGLVGVLVGAFGSHALRSKLPPERVATFETGVRYQVLHALALFAVVFVGSVSFVSSSEPAVFTRFEGRGSDGRPRSRVGCSSPGSCCSREASTCSP